MLRVFDSINRVLDFPSTYTIRIGKQGIDHVTSIRFILINRVLDSTNTVVDLHSLEYLRTSVLTLSGICDSKKKLILEVSMMGTMNLALQPYVYCMIFQSLEVLSRLDTCVFQVMDA